MIIVNQAELSFPKKEAGRWFEKTCCGWRTDGSVSQTLPAASAGLTSHGDMEQEGNISSCSSECSLCVTGPRLGDHNNKTVFFVCEMKIEREIRTTDKLIPFPKSPLLNLFNIYTPFQ